MEMLTQLAVLSVLFNPIQDGGGSSRSPTYQFLQFLVTSKNVGFSTQTPNLLTFSFHTFETLVQCFKVISNVSPKLLHLNQEHSSENRFF